MTYKSEEVSFKKQTQKSLYKSVVSWAFVIFHGLRGIPAFFLGLNFFTRITLIFCKFRNNDIFKIF